MFALFFSLYVAMFTGTWRGFDLGDIKNICTDGFNALGTLVTSIFNNVNTPMATLGNSFFELTYYGTLPTYIALISFVLALITSIGIVVMAVKGVKKAFGIFFGHIR